MTEETLTKMIQKWIDQPRRIPFTELASFYKHKAPDLAKKILEEIKK